MKCTTPVLILFAACCLVSTAAAQDPADFPKPQEEHELLQHMAGDWEIETKGQMGPDAPPMACKGAMNANSLGGVWVLANWKMDTPGMPMQAVQTIGYDPEKKQYVGTWVDSMTSHMWRYEGQFDPDKKLLSLEADGPNMMTPGKTSKYRDAYEFKSPDEIIMTSSMQGDDGKWITFSTGTMRRKK